MNGFEVDFFWPELGLVVEADGLRYHRTPAAQARDRLRDQVHTAAGLTPLRFTHDQIRFEPKHVEATLAAVADRLSAGRCGICRAIGRQTIQWLEFQAAAGSRSESNSAPQRSGSWSGGSVMVIRVAISP